MAYTDDAVKAKLSALNETQESIVTVSQWVLFHRRHADRTTSIWLQRLKDSGSNKRLNLVYLANEVVQQSKARKKDDFVIAFSPIIAEALATAYRGATNEVQQKLRRVIEVWRQRIIFEGPVQEAIEAGVDELDKSRSSNKKPLLGGSLFSSSGPAAPPEMQFLVSLQIAVSKAAATTSSAVPTAEIEYEKLTDPSKVVPAPPVYAARLSALLKTLVNAEGAVAESIKARRALLEGLEKLVETNKATLAAEEMQHSTLTTRKGAIEAKKREVEDGIMRGLSADNSPITPITDPRMNGRPCGSPLVTESLEPDRPDVEELTPPPPESITPAAEEPPPTKSANTANTGQARTQQQPSYQPPPPIFQQQQQQPPIYPSHQAGSDLLSSLNSTPVQHFAGSPSGGNSGGAVKKRKLDDESAMFGTGEDALADLDADVAELLRAESGGH